jgi:hypothetical protein
MRFDLHPFNGIDAARDWARKEIDSAAGTARGRFLTLAPGQESIYQAKYTEALAFCCADAKDDSAMFPWIAAEALTTGVPIRAVAERIRRKGDAWAQNYGPRIEALRVAGKDQLESLMDIGEIVKAARDTASALRSVREEEGA